MNKFIFGRIELRNLVSIKKKLIILKNHMNKKVLNNILVFLSRTQLQGSEMNEFNEVIEAINAELAKQQDKKIKKK